MIRLTLALARALACDLAAQLPPRPRPAWLTPELVWPDRVKLKPSPCLPPTPYDPPITEIHPPKG